MTAPTDAAVEAAFEAAVEAATAAYLKFQWSTGHNDAADAVLGPDACTRDVVHAALIAAERAAWQPIATAPLDGREFLMLLSNDWMAVASAVPHASRYAWWRTSVGLSVPMVHTHDIKTDWSDRVLATDWRPLPSPPDRADLPGEVG